MADKSETPTVQQTIDGLKQIVSEGEAKTVDLRAQVRKLQKEIQETEGQEVANARRILQQVRQGGGLSLG